MILNGQIDQFLIKYKEQICYYFKKLKITFYSILYVLYNDIIFFIFKFILYVLISVKIWSVHLKCDGGSNFFPIYFPCNLFLCTLTWSGSRRLEPTVTSWSCMNYDITALVSRSWLNILFQSLEKQKTVIRGPWKLYFFFWTFLWRNQTKGSWSRTHGYGLASYITYSFLVIEWISGSYDYNTFLTISTFLKRWMDKILFSVD